MVDLGNAKIPLIEIGVLGIVFTLLTGSIIPLGVTILVLGGTVLVLFSTRKVGFIDSSNLCYNCHAVIEADSKFCSACQMPVAVDGLATCPSCGQPVSVGAKFCKHCSHSISPATRKPVSRTAVDPASLQRRRGNTLAILGAVLASASAIAFFWGVNYTSNWSNKIQAGVGNLMTGQLDATYQVAQYCVILGIIGFIVGLVLLIVGISQR